MSEVAISFEWSRAYSAKPTEPAYVIKAGKIQQVGDRKQSYSPFTVGGSFNNAPGEGLFPVFAQLDGSPESCLAFAEKYGLLTQRARATQPPAEDLAFWRAEIKWMAGSIHSLPSVIRVANSRGTFAKVGKVDVLLIPGPGLDDPPVMVMEPGNLLEAMKLELANFVSGGGRLIPCQNCGILFKAGKAGSKRTIAQFHNDKCRIAFNNAKRRSK